MKNINYLMNREELLKKSKPILFNTEMVKAILDGRKTVTRRVIKFPINRFTKNIPITDNVSFRQIRSGKANFHEDPFFGYDVKLPYSVGDTLYVRETWSDHYVPDEYGKPKLEYCYKSDGIDIKSECLPGENNRWEPSIHMPKDAARIFLRVTDVRVERLQDITQEQICREGVETEYPFALTGEEKLYAFSRLWNSTIKKSDLETYGWDANPWVWVIEFERIMKVRNKYDRE